MSKISVIIPVYNAAQYLKRCLDSVVNQTLRDIEIICINDCSTDNSLEILDDYASTDNRIKVISHEVNGGESKARNTGLDNAIGEYIAFIDNDDEIDLDFYEKLYENAIENNADISKGNVHEIKLSGYEVYKDLNSEISESGNKMLFNGDWWSAIYKKELIQRLNLKLKEGCPLGADSKFLYKAVLNSNKLVLRDDTYYHYYRREDSGASKVLSLEKIISMFEIIQEILDDMNNQPENKLDKNGYVVLYKHYFEIVEGFAHKSNSDESIVLSAKNLLLMCQKYRYDDKTDLFDTILSDWDYLKSAMQNNDCEKLIATLKEFNPAKKVAYRLRQRIIRKGR